MPTPASPSSTSPAAPAQAAGAARFPCKQCGAKLEFTPGTDALKCPYCGTINDIPAPVEHVVELDYLSAVKELDEHAERFEHTTVKCGACAAEIEAAPNQAAMNCPFCGSALIATASTATHIKPGCVLPFAIPRQAAIDRFRAWLKSRWFAPNALKRESMLDAAMNGTYVPAWTYDTVATTNYTGQRGDAYYVTRTRTVNGRTETYQERRINWTNVSGTVVDDFDDVLVMATRSLPEDQLHKLEPWDLPALVPYRDEYLAGFRAECYQVGLKDGFELAKDIMRSRIEQSINADIGGDEQRIDFMRTRYDRITFKHLLLPVWLSAYRFNNKVYRFMVNARTGEVAGQRPYSALKITLFVIMCLIIVGIIILIASHGR